MAVMVAVAGMGLVTVFAPAASAMPPPIPPPAPGLVPGAVVAPSTLIPPVDLFYTAPDRTVWWKEGLGSGGPPIPLTNGLLISGPAPIWTGGSQEIVFGRGSDNQLWYAQISNDAWTLWHPLGGTLTSQPGAVSLGGGAYMVLVRGADGAIWQRAHRGTVWNAWQRVGGRVLPGTGPTAAYLTGNGHVYAGVVGTDRQIYLKVVNGTAGFFSIGGRTTASPALTALSSSALAAFSRGTDNAGYYSRFTEAGGAAGWRSMGGRLTSGLAAASGVVAGKATTYTFGLGTDSQVYEKIGTWAPYPPHFSGWDRVSGW
jgi:hypothetical protein